MLLNLCGALKIYMVGFRIVDSTMIRLVRSGTFFEASDQFHAINQAPFGSTFWIRNFGDPKQTPNTASPHISTIRLPLCLHFDVYKLQTTLLKCFCCEIVNLSNYSLLPSQVAVPFDGALVRIQIEF